MAWKILTILFFIIALPVILIVTIASLALFVPAKQCPEVAAESGATTLEQFSKDLERKGTATVSQEQLTYALNQSTQDKFENFRVCFEDEKLNLSGNFKLGSLSPAFYASSNLVTNPDLRLQNTQVIIGGLSFIGFRDMFGGILQQVLNDQLSKMPQDGKTYDIKISGNQMIITTKNPSKR